MLPPDVFRRALKVIQHSMLYSIFHGLWKVMLVLVFKFIVNIYLNNASRVQCTYIICARVNMSVSITVDSVLRTQKANSLQLRLNSNSQRRNLIWFAIKWGYKFVIKDSTVCWILGGTGQPQTHRTRTDVKVAVTSVLKYATDHKGGGGRQSPTKLMLSDRSVPQLTLCVLDWVAEVEPIPLQHVFFQV